jgi:hypothetical protein
MKIINNCIVNVVLILFVAIANSCDDNIPITASNRYTEDYMWNSPSESRGMLMIAYTSWPSYYYGTFIAFGDEFLEVATDDATSSNTLSNAVSFSTGLLSATNNKLDTWTAFYNKLKGVNLFLEKGLANQYYHTDSITNAKFKRRFKGEALTMRAWLHYNLLQRYAGLVDGVPMGIPIVTKSLTDEEALGMRRGTMPECVEQIVADCDSALKIDDFPEDYELGSTDLISGEAYIGAANKKIARGIKTFVYLLSASPAFNIEKNIALWDSVAKNAMISIQSFDGVPNTDALPERDFYTRNGNPDVIWASTQNAANYNYELKNLPPSLYGNGYTNPSDELVRAYYDEKGYPISKSVIYNDQNPYANRDPRLKRDILCNGMTYSGHIIETFDGGVDAPSSAGTPSKTGYYLRKFTSPDAVLYPTNNRVNGKTNFVTRIGKTDLYLIYAEAMNELAGPTDDRYGFTAKDALGKVRKRAGFNPDPYMEEVASVGKIEFRKLIHNERRVEFCFEGKRFWDIRRWLEPVNTKVSRVKIEMENGILIYRSPEVVETKLFSTPYLPIPLSETVLIRGVKQNDGW